MYEWSEVKWASVSFVSSPQKPHNLRYRNILNDDCVRCHLSTALLRALSTAQYTPANRWRSEKELALTTRICQLILLPFQIRSSKQSVGFFHSNAVRHAGAATATAVAAAAMAALAIINILLHRSSYLLSVHSPFSWAQVRVGIGIGIDDVYNSYTHTHAAVQNSQHTFFKCLVFFMWPHNLKKKKIVCFISSHKFGKAFGGEKQMKWEQKLKRKKRTSQNQFDATGWRKTTDEHHQNVYIQWQWGEWMKICHCWWWAPCISSAVNQPLFLVWKKLFVRTFVHSFVWLFVCLNVLLTTLQLTNS